MFNLYERLCTADIIFVTDFNETSYLKAVIAD